MGIIFEGITVDPVDAKDLDDAFWVSRDARGWILRVGFPFLVSMIEPGGEADQAARMRLTTRYGAKGATHMLPGKAMREGSLTRGPGKNVFLATMRIGRAFDVEHVECEVAPFRSVGQLDYDTASDLVRTGNGPLGAMLVKARDLAQGLFEKRRASGAIAYYDLARGIAFDEEGAIILMTGEGHVAEMIVREFMVLTNAGLAAWAARAGVPILYRNHQQNEAWTREEVLASLVGVATDADMNLGQNRRTMARAKVGVEPLGHYGLALSAYAWFTSPLRRYADLVNQRMLHAYLAGEPAPYDVVALTAIAEEINAKADEAATRGAEAVKEQVRAETKKLIEGGDLAGATPKSFERVVAVVSENPSSMTAAVENESLRRIAGGALSPKDLARLLLQGGRVAEAVIARLRSQPHEAPGIIAYGVNALKWSGLRFDDQHGGPNDARVYAATGHLRAGDVDHTTPPCIRSTRKSAQQAASVHLLAAIAAVIVPDETQAALPDAPAAAPPPSKPEGVAEQNPRNRLQEYCVRLKAPLPTYKTSEWGPPNERRFKTVVTVEIDGEARSSKPVQGRSKKEAEKAAAAAILATL